jgi:UDP-N-acetylglucosamine 2-epimerase
MDEKTNSVGEIRSHEEILERVKDENFVLCIVTATKPDFYKQWGLIPACEKLGMPFIVINTGQHHDDILGFGLEEFRINEHIAFDLGITGDLLQKSYETIAKTGHIARQLKSRFPKTTFLPIVHGDTLAAGIFPIGWMLGTAQKTAQNEAGLRSMAPEFDFSSAENFVEKQFEGKWTLARQEPFPEQWDTFVAGAGSEVHFAPTELNKEHLLREGYPEDRIFTVGNGIVDTMKYTRKMKPRTSVFEAYPKLEKYDSWIRVDVHRRTNLCENRMKAVVNGIDALVKEGQPIVWIELPATKASLEKFGMRDNVINLSKTYDNFLFTPIWKEYSQVMEFLGSGRCAVELTDSGSMQEELNELRLPCLTVRYNTDRPETVNEARTNILVPPKEGIFEDTVRFVMDRSQLLEEMSHGKRLYGENVGIKIVQKLKKLADAGFKPMRTVPEVFGIGKDGPVDFL